MGILDDIKGFVQELLVSQNRGPSFGEIDRRIADRPSPIEQFRQESPDFDLSKIEPTPEYQIALELVKNKEPFLFVTGRAGTGKTTFIRWLTHTYQGNIAVVAPTGLAALTAGGMTIHSFFHLPLSFVDPSDIQRVRHRAVYEHLDLLIIDEVSMVRADMMDVIERFLSLNGPDKSKPFGGVPILVVGDMHQLPPIVDQQGIRQYIATNYKSPYFFSAHSLKSIAPKPLELQRVFRQTDENFLALLNDIRTGTNLLEAVHQLNNFCYEPDFVSAVWTTLVPTRKLACQINEHYLLALTGETAEFLGEIEGKFFSTENYKEKNEDELDRMLPAPYCLQLRVGARVVFTKNSSAWVNGITGVVREIKEDVVQVQIDDEGSTVVVDVQRVTWDKYKYAYDQANNKLTKRWVGSYRQFPLALGWAMTIHKAQGQTLDRVIVDLDWGTFASGQAYVALSRARKIEGLKLRRPLVEQDVKVDAMIRQLYKVVAENDIAQRWQQR